jgi:hypothetical protein
VTSTRTAERSKAQGFWSQHSTVRANTTHRAQRATGPPGHRATGPPGHRATEAALQQLVHRLPVHPGGLHHHVRDPQTREED